LTRRILIALLALTMSVLVAAVIPLGFKATSHELRSYLDDAQAVTRSAAAVAEEQLADHRPSPDMGRILAAARRTGDTLVILNAKHRVVASVGPQSAVPAWLISEAIGERQVETHVGDKYLSVAVPVRDTGPVVGTVALARPVAPLDARIRALWLTLALIAAVAIGASAVLAFALARWVSRPLAELDASARRLGAGDLAARAATTVGPPELRRLATSFNTMAGRLETLVRGHRAMVADVSHQLRTPLAALRLRLDLLAQDADPATAAELAGGLDEFARLSRLVDGLLAVARAENTVPRPVLTDVREVIGERVAAWQPVAADRGVRLSADVSRPVTAMIGAGDLEQILDNLIANALDATAADDAITVSAEVTRGEYRQGPGHKGSAQDSSMDLVQETATSAPVRIAGGVRVVVADNGPGMSAGNRARAFGRFTTASPGGTGLGLAIVNRLVSSNGGTATLEETSGGGLSVIMQFRSPPSARAAAAKSPRSEAAGTQPDGSAPARSGEPQTT
jgi:signal transduction histidine kinase